MLCVAFSISEQKIAAWETKSSLSNTDGPYASASGSVGEWWGVDARGDAVAARHHPGESVGDMGSRKEKDKDFQGQVGRGLQCTLLKTDMMTLGVQSVDLSSAISAMLNNWRGRGKMLTSPVHAHIPCPYILPIVQSPGRRNQTLFPVLKIVPYLVTWTSYGKSDCWWSSQQHFYRGLWSECVRPPWQRPFKAQTSYNLNEAMTNSYCNISTSFMELDRHKRTGNY